MPRRPLDILVADIASRLMGVDATTVSHAYRVVLREIVEYFEIDTAFLRHNDAGRGASILVAEWPARPHTPEPDPLGVVFFEDSDPIFGATEHETDVGIYRPSEQSTRYRDRVKSASGVSSTSMVSVPLVANGRPTGVLGLVRFCDREWMTDEVAALKAVATLLAQLQGRVAAEDRLRHVALHDDLTGLFNRRSLTSHLETRLATPGDGPVAVMVLDLDRLKALNDFLGHVAGDEYIRTVASRLSERLRPLDFIARLGGDEFVVVLGGIADADGAAVRGEEIRALVGEQVTIGRERVSRNTSIGVCVAIPGVTTAAEALMYADQAALDAKNAGGNSVVIFTEAMKADNDLRSDIEMHLGSAIEDDALILHYQPEVDLRTGLITAVEALVRWRHPTRGVLPPRVFIPVAESSNLAGELGRWVLEKGCAALCRWRERLGDIELCLRLNVSPVQLVSLGFVDSVADVLARYDMPGGSICLEVTEVAVVHDIVRTRIALAGLEKLGVQVAIDDFGTGYSSLLHLKALPFDALKIDRDFVEGLGTESDDFAIVQATVRLAQSLELDVIAEGIETPTAVRILREMGCFKGQGFLISRPVEEDVFFAMLEKGEPLLDVS